MNVLGIRCSNRDFTYVVMSGTKSIPQIKSQKAIMLPKNYSKPRALHWFVQEIEHLIEKHKIDVIVIKGFEGRTRGKTYEERFELETAAFIAAGKNGINAVFKKVKSTIAKDLGLKGRGHYLKTHLDTSAIPDYSQKSDKEKEAILVGWSEL